MKKLALLICLLLPACYGAPWSIGYWNSVGNPACPVSDIDMAAVTHVIHWAALVQSNGTLDLTYHTMTTDAPTLIAAAHAAGVKVIFGVVNPYWLGQNSNLPNAVANYRAALVSNIMSVVNQYGYDGVDVDWEGAPPDFSLLGPALRAQLGTKALMAAAVVTDYRYWGAVQSSFDRINIMTYDLTGTWNPYSWHNAALYDTDGLVWSINMAVQRYTANGVPASKIGIGIPFYGYQWTGGNISAPRQNWTSTPTLTQINYNTFASQISSKIYGWDSSAHAPYLSGTNSFLTYDNEQSIADKVNYVKSNNLGGWIIWNLATDYFPNQSPKHPLLTAVKNAMGPVNSPTPPSITSTSPLAAGTVNTMYSQTLGSSGTGITWTITSGSLPTGLSLNSSTGLISGTPTVAATFSFTVRAGNTAGTNEKAFSLTIASSSTQAASVTLVTPIAGALQSSPVTITVTASTSVVSVQYLVDGVPFTTVNRAPFSYNWDTTNVSKGWHNLTAVATDSAGKSATSQPVRVRR